MRRQSSAHWGVGGPAARLDNENDAARGARSKLHQVLPARLRLQVEALHGARVDLMAALLAGLDCDFAIRQPDELDDRVRALAKRLRARVL